MENGLHQKDDGAERMEIDEEMEGEAEYENYD